MLQRRTAAPTAPPPPRGKFSGQERLGPDGFEPSIDRL